MEDGPADSSRCVSSYSAAFCRASAAFSAPRAASASASFLATSRWASALSCWAWPSSFKSSRSVTMPMTSFALPFTSSTTPLTASSGPLSAVQSPRDCDHPSVGSVQVGEGLAGGLKFGFESGDPGGLLGAGLLDDLVDRGGQVLMKFLGGPGNRGGRDREVTCQI